MKRIVKFDVSVDFFLGNDEVGLMLNNILSEMKMIQLQLYLAKRSAKKENSLSTLKEIESHINHSLHSLNHLITHIDDFKTIAESKHSATHLIKETP